MMKIYIDESNNSHCILLNKKRKFNFGTQRYFGLGFLIDPTDKMVAEYKEFISMYSNGQELKGNSLLSKSMNDAFEYYVENILNNSNYFVCVYDKKFLVASLLIISLLCGVQNGDVYCLISALCQEDDDILERYIDCLINVSEEKYYEFLYYLLNYNYKNEFLKQFIGMLVPKIIGEDDYENNIKFFPEVEYDNEKTMLNFINLTALGESLLVIKERYNVNNKDVYITHDNLENYEAYIRMELKNVNFNNIQFSDSKGSYELQMVDNCVSVVTKIISCLTDNYVGDNPYNGKLEYELSVFEKVLSKMNINNIKFCVSINHWSTILALFKTLNVRDNKKFKLEKMLSLGEIVEQIDNIPSSVEALNMLSKTNE